MAIATVTNFNPSSSTVTVAEYITAEAITSIINITKGIDIYVVGHSSLVSAVYNINTGTLITVSGALSGSEITDIVVVRYSGKGIYIKPDWNATPGSSAEILNQPTLGTAALADANDFATPAQGQLAESALQPEDIGLTVQGFNAGTVIDPDYNQFSDDEKTKLAGIESGAQVNPDVSIYAPLSSPIFTDFPQLPNNTRINGVEHFYQTTKPVTRGDGSALVVSDRWWKVDDGTEWFWNGTYWLSMQLFSSSITFTGMQFNYSWAGASTPPPPTKIFLVNQFFALVNTDGLAQSGYTWSSLWVFRGANNLAVSGGLLPAITITFDGSPAYYQEQTLNTYVDLSLMKIIGGQYTRSPMLTFVVSGTSGIRYRLVA